MKKIKTDYSNCILVSFGMLHCYTEWKFNNDPPKGVIERINEWTDKIGLD
ncbi:hypothetical protein KK423_15555 [Clostridioides difficile]|nr:hypothetical protein [Clostridioides difficile]